ncbi:MAG: hypothetical protein WHU94_09925 [Thermogemmata sp.]
MSKLRKAGYTGEAVALQPEPAFPVDPNLGDDLMSRARQVLGLFLVTLFGVYGCTQGQIGGREKSALEAKIQRLEEEVRSAHTAQQQLRQKLLAAEERQVQLQKQLEQWQAQAAAEREALRAELKVRTAERDALAAHYDKFRKDLRDLLQQAEATLPGISPAVAPPPSAVSARSATEPLP